MKVRPVSGLRGPAGHAGPRAAQQARRQRAAAGAAGALERGGGGGEPGAVLWRPGAKKRRHKDSQ